MEKTAKNEIDKLFKDLFDRIKNDPDIKNAEKEMKEDNDDAVYQRLCAESIQDKGTG